MPLLSHLYFSHRLYLLHRLQALLFFLAPPTNARTSSSVFPHFRTLPDITTILLITCHFSFSCMIAKDTGKKHFVAALRLSVRQWIYNENVLLFGYECQAKILLLFFFFDFSISFSTDRILSDPFSHPPAASFFDSPDSSL